MGKIFNNLRQKEKRKSFRSNMPPAEVILWSALKGKRLSGHKFRRQHSVGKYVMDFYCPELKLAVEVDGASHFIPGGPEHDEARRKFIERYGVRFLRFTNNDIYQNLERVLMAIDTAAKKIVSNTSKEDSGNI